MRHFKIRIAALGLVAACWGIMFPEYTYTADSYAVLYEDKTEGAGMNAGGEDAPDREGYGKIDNAGTPQEVIKAAKEGKVSYRFKLFDFLRKYFGGTAAGK